MYVSQVVLKNVRGFEELDFSFQRPDGSYAGWTVFVGGNGSGKSTLLKSIAMGLGGPGLSAIAHKDSAFWVRKGETHAQCNVLSVIDGRFDGTDETLTDGYLVERAVVWINRGQRSVTSAWETSDLEPISSNTPGWFSAGYGPMRRLTGTSAEVMRVQERSPIAARFATLFREDAALSGSEEWLRLMHARTLERERSDRDQLVALLKGILSLLNDGLLPHGMKIHRLTVDTVFVMDKSGTELPLGEISDGYRGVMAMVINLVHHMYEVYGSEGLFGTDSSGRPIVDKPGVVLIDEVEAHLHPTWQRDLPEWLKVHFPRIQFLVTTHSPLVAQAADPNGLFLLPAPGEGDRVPRPLTEAEYTKVRMGSAHKTVLGIAFGLNTTRSKWAEAQIGRWQTLEAKRHAGVELTKAEAKEREKLRGMLQTTMEEEFAADRVQG